MKTHAQRKILSRFLALTPARALTIAGFLFCATGAKAQFDPSSGGPTNLVLESWSFFDSTNWFDDDGYLPVSFTNIAGSNLGDFQTLVVDTNVPAWLRYNVVENDGTTNLSVQQGSVTFWFAPGSWSGTNTGGAGPGEYGRLLEVGSYTPDSSYGWWSIYVDDVGNNLYFSAQTNDLSSNATTYVTAPIDWTTNYFHFIALTYCATSTVLYLDGVYATNGPGVTVYPGPEVLTNGFGIGSDTNGIYQAHGLFDLVAIYNYPMNSNDVWLNYQNQMWSFAINPNNPPMFNSVSNTPVSFGTNLSIVTFNLSNNLASLFVVNTGPDIMYEMQACTNLSQGNWFSEGFLNGSELTNWTLANVPISKQGNLFLRIRSWLSSDGSGLPNWWEQQYFGTNSVDPNALDSANDGWTIYQKFELGINPGVFYTPPAPQGLTLSSYNAGTSTATLTWLPSPGPVTGYTIQTPSGNFNTSSTTFADNVSSLTASYRVQAHYPGGDSAWSAYVSVPADFPISLIAGPQTSAYLVVPSLPAGASKIRVSRYDLFAEGIYNDYSFDRYFDLPITTITNGFCQIPAACVEGLADFYGYANYLWEAQILDTNSYALSQVVDFGVGYGNVEGNGPDWMIPPYFDGRQQLKQNLIFQLRAANKDNQFQLQDHSVISALVSFSPYYIYEGLYDINNDNLIYGSPYAYPLLDTYLPFEDNYMFRNFVYSAANVDTNGVLTTGVVAPDLDFDTENPYLELPPTFQFQPPATNGITIPSLLSTNDARWICMYPLTLNYADGSEPPIGFSMQLSGYTLQWTLNSGVSNYWGLPYVSAEVYYANANNNSPNGVVNAGSSIYSISDGLPVYMETAQPQFQTVEYDFWNVTDAEHNPGNICIPGMTNFVTSRTSDVLITSVGNPDFAVAGYAKLAVTNGYSGVYGYLGQYFDTAYQITNGVVTTNQTGVLSPYGQFFATQPGMTALVTMPDTDTGARGTNIVRVISLNVDANHDGTLDFTYWGPDFVSSGKPFRFWVNDDQDSGDYGGNGGIPGLIGSQADGYNYQELGYNNNSLYRVHGARDLVDFFPVYVNIGSLFQSNAFSAGISATDTNYQFILSQADGVLRFGYTDLTPTNYMNFLRDTNEARTLGGYPGETGFYAGAQLTTITNVVNGGVALSPLFVAGIATNNQGIILVEAAAPTTQPLVLSIYHGSNLLAQTSLSLSVSGVEQMFRHKNLLLNTNLMVKADRLTDASVPNEPNTIDKNFVFLHGYNVNPQQARGWDADIYKRMYWSGSHAKFYGVTWEAADSQVASQVTINLQTNIVNAFNTAPLLNTFLNSLSGTNVVAAHSLGNMVVLSALNDYSNQNINTYFMIDAAVAIEAIDSGASLNPDMYPSAWTNYQSRLWASKWFNLWPTNDARNTLTWSGRLANLQNASVYNFYSSGEEVLRRQKPSGSPRPSLLKRRPT